MTPTPTPTPTQDSPDYQATVDGYFACWNSTDTNVRRAAIERTWAPEARSVDPLTDAVGHDALDSMFSAFHDAYPGHSFRQRGGPDAHHGYVRWGWEMLDSTGTPILDGIDVAIVDDDGIIQGLAGFFGSDLPSAC